ncbi:MAG: hypothetical protein ACI8W3_002714 [Myxococcota bacterium]|jgi:hypothetical protein
MIYLQQDFDLQPASARTRDAFVALAEQQLVPGATRHGAKFIAAFYGNQDWFFRATHLLEFPDLSAFDSWRQDTARDAAACDAAKQAEAMTASRNEMLLESVGAIADTALTAGIEAAKEKPQGTYTAAHLKVANGRMEEFEKMLEGAGAGLPILASWRPIAGDPSLVIDLWKGDVERGFSQYEPATEAQNAFLDPLRELAPNERMVRYFPLPYSPLV